MKKRILSMLTAAMMSSTCFFVGAEQICAAEYPSFTLRLNQHTGNAEFMEDETDKKVIFTATCLKYSGSDVELVDAKTNEVVAKMLDDGNFDVSGDDLENDRTWSAVLSFENAAVGSYSYYARLTDADGTVSTTKTFSVVIYDAVSDADAERMAEIAQKVGVLSSDTTFQNADQETRKQMADALFEQLIAEGYVKENSVNYDEEKHCYAYQCEGVGGFSDVTCYLDIAVKDPDQVSPGIATDVTLSSSAKRLQVDSEEMSVLFTAETAANVDSISLIDASTNQEVAMLYDDGTATYPNDGDLYENDGVYSNYLDLSGNQVGDYSYYAQYTVNGKTYTSDTVTVRVYRQFTEQELADMQKITDTLNALINSEEYAALSVEKKVKALSDRINSLAEVDETLGYALVDADSIRYNNVTYQFEFKDYIGLNYVYYAYTIPNTDATDSSAFTYVNHGDSIEITGFDNSVSDVVIPSEIEGLPVTAISTGAFYLSAITSIEVPDTVTSIGEMAFLGCTSLKTVKLSTGVAKIEKNAFGSCSALQEVQVAKDNPNFSSLDGVLYSKAQDTLVIYPAAKTDAAYTIPGGVTSVAMYAFSENPYLETLTIPNSLIKVGDSAFFNCKNLRSVSYNGTEEEWNQITIGLLNEKLTGANIQYQERILGDVNADGALTISDVVLLQKWLLAVPDTQLADWKAADFNEDQTLNGFDLCQMRYALLKQEENAKQ
ncbi:leucine-rich repeat protein [Ruminococcus sp.]|uniref:leucine-rich repeat protein n=1 Tax=Ruminococcus sp. TaxID=41978 RepID=UPI002E79B749|nr:leucine-rich repeat protein [Ruminococcus sp.]MEE0142626.1 leucine-rich repeat protein [Ruminococcus sp.]